MSLFDAICIIVGTIIGAGIFRTAPTIATFSESFGWMIGLWLFGGFITVLGALCFAELTTRFVDVAGGDYGFLKISYGKPVGFMFAWATFWIIRPGNIGAMALTFASYFDKVLGFGDEGSQIRMAIFTILAVLILSGINLIGLKQGKRIQNVLTVTKVLGIAAIIAIAFLSPVNDGNLTSAKTLTSAGSGMWLVALVFVMFSFGGWNDISFVATEIKSPERNLFRALIFGAVLVTTIYVTINCAFVAALGFENVAQSKAVATDVVQQSFGVESWVGQRGGQLIAALICISCLGAINGIIITSPRIYYAAGKDYPLLKSLGQWNLKRDQPWIATLAQAGVTIAFCLLCFQYEKPFDVILITSAPFFWAFLGMAGLSVIVLRYRRLDFAQENAFRVPLFPIEPLVLATACFAMTYASFKHMLEEELWLAMSAVFGMMFVGVLLGVLLSAKPSEFDNTADN